MKPLGDNKEILNNPSPSFQIYLECWNYRQPKLAEYKLFPPKAVKFSFDNAKRLEIGR